MPTTQNRLLFAINHKATEDKVMELVAGSCVCVGAVTYKEAVVPAIIENKADIVLIRDTLGGSLSEIDLVQQVRMECPTVRIIYISKQRPKGDPLISSIIGYGVYDVIISDSVQLQTIVSYIKQPRTIRDVAAYYRPMADVCEEPAEDEEQNKKGKGSGLFGIFGQKPKPEPVVPVRRQPHEESAKPNIEALRASIEEEAKRKAQEGMQQVVDSEVEKRTRELEQKLAENERALEAATTALQTRNNSAAEAGYKLNQLRDEMETMRANHKTEVERLEELNRSYEEQLAATKSTPDPEWYLSKSRELEAENEGLRKKLEELRKTEGEDFSLEDVQILPDMPETVDPGDSHVFLFVGAKHGLGTTTAALNTASLLAAGGHKTVLIELNRSFPMVSQYFEFTNLLSGIDTALAGVKNGNLRQLEAAIIKPHGLKPSTRALGKAYSKLPGGLHFMAFSNACLLGNGQSLAVDALGDLVYSLVMRLKYSYVVIDVQVDDKELYEACVGEDIGVDRLVMVTGQDPHALASAGRLIGGIAKTVPKLIHGAVYVAEQYVSGIDPAPAKIARYLNVPAKKLLTITANRPEHLKAAMTALPYVYGGGEGVQEYKHLAESVCNGVR